MATQEKIAQPSAMPPSLLLYQMAVGHYFSRTLALATKLNVADLLKDGPKPYGELAGATGTHAPSLNRVMRLLASAGVFEEREGGNFALTPLGEYLRTDVPGSMRASVMLFAGEGIQDSWKELEYCVRTGEPAFHRTSPDADAFSNLRGIVFDQPHAAQKAKSKINEAGLDSRCEAVAGDFFKAVPAGADAYLLKHVIHDWNDERAVTILKNCHRVMGPNGKPLIVEGIYPMRIDQTEVSRGAAANDVNMLVCTGGRQRSEAEFRSLYDAAGFKLTRIVPTPARVCVIEGVRA